METKDLIQNVRKQLKEIIAKHKSENANDNNCYHYNNAINSAQIIINDKNIESSYELQRSLVNACFEAHKDAEPTKLLGFVKGRRNYEVHTELARVVKYLLDQHETLTKELQAKVEKLKQKKSDLVEKHSQIKTERDEATGRVKESRDFVGEFFTSVTTGMKAMSQQNEKMLTWIEKTPQLTMGEEPTELENGLPNDQRSKRKRRDSENGAPSAKKNRIREVSESGYEEKLKEYFDDMRFAALSKLSYIIRQYEKQEKILGDKKHTLDGKETTDSLNVKTLVKNWLRVLLIYGPYKSSYVLKKNFDKHATRYDPSLLNKPIPGLDKVVLSDVLKYIEESEPRYKDHSFIGKLRVDYYTVCNNAIANESDDFLQRDKALYDTIRSHLENAQKSMKQPSTPGASRSGRSTPRK